MAKTNARLFVVSAPSGAGKTTLISHVLNRFGSLSYSISHTTRQPRKGEIEGKDYFFVSKAAFKEKIESDQMLEWAKVHDNFYGTSRQFVDARLEEGRSLLLDIDVQGAAQIMSSDFDPVTIFIMPPSFETLEQRLRQRGTDSEQVIATRLMNARIEMNSKDKYQYVLINDHLDQAIEALCEIFKKEMQ